MHFEITLLFLVGILLCLMSVMVLVIYLVDRIRFVAQRSGTPLTEEMVTTDSRFAALSGESLWAALTSQAPATDGENSLVIESVRRHYAEVLERHVEELFEEGVMDGRQGVRVPPPSTRLIKTAGGVVNSWLPVEDSTRIYYAGHERTGASAEQLDSLRDRLDTLASGLFEKTGCRPSRRISDTLIPRANPLLANTVAAAVVPDILPGPGTERVGVQAAPEHSAA